jgi:hypothetical protein
MYSAGKSCFTHQGNKQFRYLVSKYLDRYCKVSDKLEKSKLIQKIVHEVKSQHPKGRFLRKDSVTGHWKEVSDYLIKVKVGQSIRDAIKSRDRSGRKTGPSTRNAEHKSITLQFTRSSGRLPQTDFDNSDIIEKARSIGKYPFWVSITSQVRNTEHFESR